MATVGIIANPASGKDIRRLVARGSVFDNNEKVNIVRRVLLGLDAIGVDEVLLMPDAFGIGTRALDGMRLRLAARVMEMEYQLSQEDSTRAAEIMARDGIGAIVTLGGDGTNRAVARGSGRVPLVPISTGTNNVFPSMIEGTLAGLAAGLVATRKVEAATCVVQRKRLEVFVDGVYRDLALVDVALTNRTFVAARAVWDPATLRAVVLAIAEPGSLGLSSIGAHLAPIDRTDPAGLWIAMAEPPAVRDGHADANGLRRVLAPIAPGLLATLTVASHGRFAAGEEVLLPAEPGCLALDGEREIELTGRERVSVRLTFDGPPVVDVAKALEAAALGGHFVR